MTPMIRVRFAPSPTGSLHIGNLRTALYDQLLAMRHGGNFVVRIEDTDQTRLVENGVENILRTLAWAGIFPDEGPYLDEQGKVQERGNFGPYIQSQRLDIYRQYAQILLEKGHAYYCFCTAERLEEVKKGQMASKQAMMYDRHCRNFTALEVENKLKETSSYVLRLRVPDEGITEFDDAIRGHVHFNNTVVDDQVLLKSDGFPTYHLASVVDDHLMEITHIIRGEEWLPSTPKHVLLYKAFGWEPPIFAHLPLLLNPDRSKLSKRQGDVAVEDYRRQGYLPEAIINFIALLGWNPSDTQELYAKEELAKEFSLEKVNRAGAIFNREKLDWINHEYLKKLSPDRLMTLALPFFAATNVFRVEDGQLIGAMDGEKFENDFFKKTLILEQQRVKTLAELPEATAYFFTSNLVIDKTILPWKKSTPEIAVARLQGLSEFLRTQPTTLFDDIKKLESATIAFVATQGWTNAESLWPLRVSLTGRAMSPSPFEVAWTLGKEKTLLRIEQAITLLA